MTTPLQPPPATREGTVLSLRTHTQEAFLVSALCLGRSSQATTIHSSDATRTLARPGRHLTKLRRLPRDQDEQHRVPAPRSSVVMRRFKRGLRNRKFQNYSSGKDVVKSHFPWGSERDTMGPGPTAGPYAGRMLSFQGALLITSL